ncbi:MAG: hypothetical protein R2813_11870 [Flavobacteriales bacterium]
MILPFQFGCVLLDTHPLLLSFFTHVPIEFVLFALLLLSIAVFHKHVFPIAIAGVVIIAVYKLMFTELDMAHHLLHESLTLVNLLGLLVGFAVLTGFFEKSKLPDLLPNYLPDDWKGGALLIVAVAILSTFLDNIAAAIIGGTVARKVYHGKVHIAFVASIVASSNAGGAGSVIGDTTTTMMWIGGVPAFGVVHAYLGSIPCVTLLAIMGGTIQQSYHPIQKDAEPGIRVQSKYLIASALIIAGVIAANVLIDFPAAGVWLAIGVSLLFVNYEWSSMPSAFKGAIFLICLVFAASMMPVDQLPEPTWISTLTLGFVSAIFDNIPLTKLALSQGGYDWGILAYAVGFGGSMIWFGSSAGVAISGLFPEARSTVKWISNAWFVVLAYLVGFGTVLLMHGWHPLAL